MESIRIELQPLPDIVKEVVAVLGLNGINVSKDEFAPNHIICTEATPDTKATRYDRLVALLQRVNKCRVPLKSLLSSMAEGKSTDISAMPFLVILRMLGVSKTVVPLHSNRDLIKESINGSMWMGESRDRRTLDLSRIAAYDGPQVSLYFRFIHKYITWLLLPALLALVSIFVTPIEAKHWAMISVLWGTVAVVRTWRSLVATIPEQNESRMHLFAYHGIMSNVTYYMRYSLSYSGFAIFLTTVVLILFASIKVTIPMLDDGLSETTMHTIARIIMGLAFEPVARLLTCLEHHIEDSSYETSRYTKVLILRIVSFYAYPISLAFTSHNPLLDTERFLSGTFTLSLAISTITEMLPWLYAKFVTRKRGPLAWEGQDWDVNDEYLEMATQYANLMAFGFVFPRSFLIAFINNIAEGYLDAQKLYMSKRCFPALTNVAGMWSRVFQAISIIGVMVNIVILARVGSVGEALTIFLVFIGMKATFII